jgi:hypothetical protein
VNTRPEDPLLGLAAALTVGLRGTGLVTVMLATGKTSATAVEKRVI